jgi:tRNA(fMet)-specific endonuclease VapC
MLYMLDTNICIYIAKRHPQSLLHRFQRLEQGQAVMSAVTHAELRAGIEIQVANRAHDEKVLGLIVSRVPVVPFDEEASIVYGRLRAAVPDRRRDALDRLIAAHALSMGATLVTNNETDFKDYPGLMVENWVAAS